MDRTTIDYYNQDAEVLYHTYQSVQGGVRDFFPTAFSVQSRILDIGAGSGRDMIELLNNGHDVYGIDGSESLIEYDEPYILDTKKWKIRCNKSPKNRRCLCHQKEGTMIPSLEQK